MSNEEEGKFSESAKVAQEVFDAKLKTFNIEKERAKKEKEIADFLGDQLEAAKQQIRIDDIKLNNLTQYVEQLQKSNEALTEQLLSVDDLREKFGLTEKQAKRLRDIAKDQHKTFEDITLEVEKMRAELAISTKFANKIDSAAGSLAQKMGMAKNASEGLAGSLMEGIGLLLTGDMKSNLFSLAGGIVGLFNPINIFSSLMSKAFDIFDKFNRKAVEMRKSTGRLLTDIENQMRSVSAETAKFGVSLDEVNESLSSMQEGLIGIQNLKYAEDLAKSASMMKMLGIDTSTTAQNMNMLMNTFKDSSKNVMPGMEKDLESMAVNAEKIGISAKKLATDFGTAMSYLAIEGKQKGIKVFEDLAAQASVTGTAISKMLDMTKAFDKFGDGAKKAATLNAVLGTSLSTMALMTMDPAERMKELRNQINLATGGVNNMTRAQKLFTAEAMGYSSVQEMLADLQGDPAEMEKRANLMQKQADIQARLNNAMNELVPIMDKVSRMFENFVRENPQAIETVAKAAMGFVNVMTRILNILPEVSAAATVLYGVYQYLDYTQKAAALSAANNAIAQAEAALKNELSAAAQAKQSAIISANTTVVNANSLAWLRNSAKVGLAVAALLALYYMFHKTGSPMLYLMPLVMAGFIIIMSQALEKMSVQAMLGALALAVLAAGVALVFYGMSAFVESLTSFFTVLISSMEVLPMLAVNMYLLGGAFLFLGISAMTSSMGIFMGLAGLTALFLLFKLTGTSMKDMFGAGDEIFKIGSGIEKFGQGLNNIKSAVSEIKSSIGSKGLFAGSISGDTSSLVMGDGVAIGKLFSNNKIEVDVKMPEISMPKIDVKVYIGNEELRDIVRKEITRNQR